MLVHDITGVIKEGMWNYEPPFPRFSMQPLGEVPWAGCEVFCEVFGGLHSQTGTYLETPAHYYGSKRSYTAADIPVQKLVDIPCTVLVPDLRHLDNCKERLPVTADMLANCPESSGISSGGAILVGTGWGRYWMDERYLRLSPYFTLDAVMWLISKNPFLLGSDFPRWENFDKPQGFFPEFYARDILMLAPCVNLEKLRGRHKLTALPLNIPGTSCIPCRAILTEDNWNENS